jgi:hypothetical protein
MSSWYHSLKPAAPARVHLLLAAMMWTVVGGSLIFFGAHWVTANQKAHTAWLTAAAVGIGLLKSRFMLDRAARRIAERIRKRGDGRCIGGFLSWGTWGFVLLMMICGRLLRTGALPHFEVGLVYTAIGSGLLCSARTFWLAWYRHPGRSPG